ncbi:MAG TPA: hypothetical protein PKN32_05665 [Bacteroidales bacterium]|nr:hypothetical protein [Bacteroidales bacterium]
MKRTLIIFYLVLFSAIGYAQNEKSFFNAEMIKLGWNIASPYLTAQIKDPLTKEIVTKTVPKLIDQDIKASVYEFTNSFYTVKGIKVLNKEFLSKLEISITKGINAVKTKDYITAVNEIIEIVSLGSSYLDIGLLNLADSKMSNSPTFDKSLLFSTSTLTEKLFVSNLNYLFFIDNGKLIIDYQDEESESFIIEMNSGATYEIGVLSIEMEDPIYLESLKADKELLNNFNRDFVNLMMESLGSGSILKTEFSDEYNFKSLKYTYAYTSNEDSQSYMAYFIFVFNGNSVYMIVLNSTTETFTQVKPDFAHLMENFYIVGIDETKIIEPCEANRTGQLILNNNSTNPYDVYFNGQYQFRMSGGSSKNVDIKEGKCSIYVKQVSGYAFYPTEVTKELSNVERCQKYRVAFP